MSIDICLRSAGAPVPGELRLQLNDEALYGFLHPRFVDLAERTGQYIDLYGDATFETRDLPSLRLMLAASRKDAEQQPDAWNVHVGTQTVPEYRELYRPLTCAAVLACLDRWDNLVVEAEMGGCAIVCIGD